MNLLLMQYGYPIANISGDRKNRFRYYDALELCHSGDKSQFLLFIAQEVKAALDSVGVDSAIFIDISDGQVQTNGLKALRHIEMIAPIVKAIQEQNKIIQQLQQQVTALQQQINPSSGSGS